MNQSHNVNNDDTQPTSSVAVVVQSLVNNAVSAQSESATQNNSSPPAPSSDQPQIAQPRTGNDQRPSPREMYEIYCAANHFYDSQSEVEVRRSTFTGNPAGVPPRYSAVMRQGRPSLDIRRDARSMEGQHISPFSTRVPPPTYSQVEGVWSREISASSSDQVMFGPDPLYIWCTRCGGIVVTTTQHERSKFTHFTAMALCICGCWPCCILPYCMDSCKNTYHYCPECNQLLGTYRPW